MILHLPINNERKGYSELLAALEKCGTDDPKPLLDCFLENDIDPVLTCVVVRKLYRYGYDSCGKTLDYFQKFKDHPSECHTKEDWKVPAKATERPHEVIKREEAIKAPKEKRKPPKAAMENHWLQEAMF